MLLPPRGALWRCGWGKAGASFFAGGSGFYAASAAASDEAATAAAGYFGGVGRAARLDEARCRGGLALPTASLTSATS